jgi:hypothetical protein
VRGARPITALRRAVAAAVADPSAAGAVVDHYVGRYGHARLIEAAASHGVAPRVWGAVVAAGRSAEPAAAPLFLEVKRVHLRHARALADLRTAHAVLGREGIVPTVVKGPALSDLMYRERGQRSYDDLDLIIAPGQLGRAFAALQGSGFVSLDRNWPGLQRLRVGELRLRTPSGGVLDLHWHLLNNAALRPAFDVARHRWQARLVETDLGGVRVTVMDPAATLVHVGLHAALAGGHRLVWLQDVAELVTVAAPEWEQVYELADITGSGLALGTMLARTRRVLGTPIPDAVIRRLVPGGGWRTLAAVADRVSPPSMPPREGSLGQLVARSCRVDGQASTREFVRRTRTWTVQGSRTEKRTARHLFDAADPLSMAHPVPDEQAQRQFLADVAAEDR